MIIPAQAGSTYGNASPIFLYDDVCVLCSVAVKHVIAHERQRTIEFISIASEEGSRLAVGFGINPTDPESFVFVSEGVAFTKSDAVFAIVERLNGPAQLLLLARHLPRRIRDGVYDFIARNRYRIFGRRQSCELP
ncbi:DUF393 domain-containing protein [Rhizobium laguerreae]|uniref:thiol-disulfide oxidoreductase DCC family protein n=1 Tax=Rhizobium laguerreae TaxID=1076926 RepID=UPI001C91B689|nr:DCC1-like thiol-disulfide oxidoreductase family protein [Rhizobium laguerreae]MBY3301064.1 DUF393 domain-containing protein [Rhizobium laguerreae]